MRFCRGCVSNPGCREPLSGRRRFCLRCAHLKKRDGDRRYDEDRLKRRKIRNLARRARGPVSDSELEARFRAHDVATRQDSLYLLWANLKHIRSRLYGPPAFVPLEILMQYDGR